MKNMHSASVRRIAHSMRSLMLALVTAVTFAGLVAYAPLPAAANASIALPSQQPLANIEAGYALPDSDPFIRSELYFGTNRPGRRR